MDKYDNSLYSLARCNAYMMDIFVRVGLFVVYNHKQNKFAKSLSVVYNNKLNKFAKSLFEVRMYVSASSTAGAAIATAASWWVFWWRDSCGDSSVLLHHF
jgi:hypothetical protein